jgi:hypothetical protein
MFATSHSVLNASEMLEITAFRLHAFCGHDDHPRGSRMVPRHPDPASAG